MQASFRACLALMIGVGMNVCWAQTPCKSPPLFSGAVSVASQNEQLAYSGNYAYDALNQRIFLGEKGTFNGSHFGFHALYLFQEKVLYTFRYQEQSCAKTALEVDFIPMEVPPGASFLGQVVLGTLSGAGQGLVVDTWWGTDRQGTGLISFTKLSCLPVSRFVETKEIGWTSVSYFDIVLGVEDPNVFIPPPFCKDAILEESKDGHKADLFSFLHRKMK